jgi:hypothetical protein
MTSALLTRGLLSSALLFSMSAATFAQADEKAKAAAANSADVNAEEETAALKFAKEHHPELAKLLGPMKSARPKEYQKAVREIGRVAERLTRMQTRAPERYAIEVDLWKTESRLRLIAARTAMVDDDERREQIEKLVTDRNTLKIRLLEFEREEAQGRISQIDKQIETLKAQESNAVRKEVDRLVNSAKSSASRVKTKLEKSVDSSTPASEKPKPANPKRAPGSTSASK